MSISNHLKKINIIVSIGFTILAAVYFWKKIDNLYVQICVDVAVGLISWWIFELYIVIFEIRNKHNVFLQKIQDSLYNIDIKIDNQLSKIIEQTALFTENNVLEEKLKYLKEKKGPSVWVISKFISKQIAKNLKEFKFKINASDYSNFSYQLYFEPNHNLYLTNSINFYSWFKMLMDKNKFFETIENIYNPKNDFSNEYDIPPHIKAWNLLQINKKRLIVFSQNEMELLFIYKPFFDTFIEITTNPRSKESTKFISSEKFTEKVNDNFNPMQYDYAIFDNNVLLRWNNPVYEDDETDLEIITNFDNTSPILNIFDDNFWVQLKSIEQVKKEIKNKKERIITNTVKNKYLDHKYSYFAYGSEIWQKINSDTNYTLGKNEQEFIHYFLKGKINKDYEIFHLGSGGGMEIETIFNSIPHNHINTYTVVDISPDVLNNAKKTIKKILKSTNHCSYIKADLLDDSFRAIITPSTTSHRLFLLVANGFLLSNDKVLDNISRTMTSNDILIITVESGTNIDAEKIIKSYKSEYVLQLFNISLNILDIYCTDEKYFEFEFNAPDFIGYFKIKDWINNNPDYSNLKIKNYIKENDKIKIFTSFKPNEEQFKNRLQKFNLIPITNSIEVNNDYSQIGGIFIKKK